MDSLSISCSSPASPLPSIKEAALWLGYTYLYVRMLKNPTLYGVSVDELENDPTLLQRRLDLAHSAALVLDKANMIRYDRTSCAFQTTNLGRVASHYYVSCDSVKVFNDLLKPQMTDVEIFRLFSLSGEFKNVHVREEEKLELSKRAPGGIQNNLEQHTNRDL